MNPMSVPVIPAQPDLPEYPATDLNTFQQYPNPQAYEQAFGVPPPAWDTSRDVQYWFDSSAPTAVGAAYEYQALGTDSNGDPAVVAMLVPALWARTPNIPGITNAENNVPVQPIPVRALLPNEQLFLNDLAGIQTPYVLRTDLQGALPAQYTQSDKAIIARLGAYLTKQGA
jgi:hypothetical protein